MPKIRAALWDFDASPATALMPDGVEIAGYATLSIEHRLTDGRRSIEGSFWCGPTESQLYTFDLPRFRLRVGSKEIEVATVAQRAALGSTDPQATRFDFVDAEHLKD